AARFGAGADMDAFYFAWAVVQAVTNLVFAGALGATVIPLLQARRALPQTDRDEVARFAVTTTLVVASAAGILAVLLCWWTPWIVDLLSPAMPETLRTRCVRFVRFFVALVPFNALIGLPALILNAHDEFIRPALVFVVNNVIFSAVAASSAAAFGADALVLAAVTGPLVTATWLAIHLARMGLLRAIRPDLGWAFLRPFWRLS